MDGETLGVLAQRYGVSVDVIAAANQIQDVNMIYAGWGLLIP